MKKKRKKGKSSKKSNSKKRYNNTSKINNKQNKQTKQVTIKKEEIIEEKETIKQTEKTNKKQINEKEQNIKEKNETNQTKNTGGTKTKPKEKKEKTKNKHAQTKKENENKRGETKRKNKKTNKKEHKVNKKTVIKLAIMIGIIILASIGALTYLIISPKFKNIQIELGTKEIKAENFVTNKIYKNKAEFVTDIATIDLSQVGEYDITLKYRNKEETVKLKIADTIPPEVNFRNIVKYIDYEINPEDFIIDKKDESEMIVEIGTVPELTEFKDYEVEVKVKDKYGNETTKKCILTITWIKSEVEIELGGEISASDLVFNVEEYGENVSKEDLANVNTLVLGEYIVKTEKDGIQYETKVKVQDTTPPVLELKDITIYDDEKVNNYKNFITEVSDISGEPTTTLKTEIKYGIVGTQEIVIEAVDVNGNKTEKTAILTIKKDTDGPVISGIKDIQVAKYSTIDYYSGVSANDKKDGKCEVTVDSSNVNTSSAGTYYATYTSKDTKGNTTTAKRKIVVNHDQEDTNAKMDAFYNNYCAGKDPVGIASAVREHIRYNSNWGGDDPIWYGLTEGKGNCYVHASVLKRALEKAGYQNRIIYLKDQSHYWNLVYVNGVWRHIDGTPSSNHTLGLLTDEQKLADPGVHQRTWDREAWPAAD